MLVSNVERQERRTSKYCNHLALPESALRSISRLLWAAAMLLTSDAGGERCSLLTSRALTFACVYIYVNVFGDILLYGRNDEEKK